MRGKRLLGGGRGGWMGQVEQIWNDNGPLSDVITLFGKRIKKSPLWISASLYLTAADTHLLTNTPICPYTLTHPSYGPSHSSSSAEIKNSIKMPGVPGAVESHTFITATICQARTRRGGDLSFSPSPSVFVSVHLSQHRASLRADNSWKRVGVRDGGRQGGRDVEKEREGEGEIKRPKS